MNRVPAFRLALNAEEEAVIVAVLRSGQIALGPDIEQFERELGAAVGVGHVAAVSSGFASIHLSLAALGIGSGDEVIVPCGSTCAAIRDATFAAGGVPVFADTNATDFNLDPARVEQRMTRRTRAIISPHHTGILSPITELMRLGVPVIEDCAQAVGAWAGARPAGSLSTLSVFSFYATKLLTTVDGGAVAGNQGDLVERVRDLRYYGGSWDGRPRYNYKMQNLGAALGRVQLKGLGIALARRQMIAAAYRKALADCGAPPDSAVMGNDGGVCYRFAFRVPATHQGRIREELERRGVPCRREMEFLASDPEAYPAARRLVSEVLTLPTYPALTDVEVEFISTVLVDVVRSILGEQWRLER
jgi:dTDP-4-amino-4,6-dideoxygalactose transaminase